MIKQESYFKGKRIVIMGLGLLGGALNDALFLAKEGAELLVTDLKTKEQLQTSIARLKKFEKPSRTRPGITYVLGEHRIKDFQNADMILQPGNVPIDSPYLKEAQKNDIPVFVSESLFALYAKGVKLVGVTGTRGKTTTTQLIYHILKKSSRGLGKVFLGGNIQNVSTLALLHMVKPGDVVVMELDSWALHGMGEIRKSPDIAVFTNLLKDHLNYYQKDGVAESVAMERYFTDKAQIFLHQKKGDVIIVTDQIIEKVEAMHPKGRVILAGEHSIPKGTKTALLGEHNRMNIACAIEAVRALGVSEKVIKDGVAGFMGVAGRMELLRTWRGVRIYNDTCATTPDATVAALEALTPTLKKGAKIVLIFGGADKQLDMGKLVSVLPEKVVDAVLLTGSGTEKLCQMYAGVTHFPVYDSLVSAVKHALSKTKKDDVLLFSPAFASFGMFKNEYDRGEQFVKLIKKL